MKGLVLILAIAGVLTASWVTSASAGPGSGNPRAQLRTFTCDNGITYTDAVFVGFASGSFLLADSTDVFAIKIFSEYTSLGGDLIATFNYGIAGFEGVPLLSCSYTDPQGIYNLFQGFITPRS
jgi:hypothetical protein